MPTAAVAAVAKLQPQFVMSNVSCLLTEREAAKGAGKGGEAQRKGHMLGTHVLLWAELCGKLPDKALLTFVPK